MEYRNTTNRLFTNVVCLVPIQIHSCNSIVVQIAGSAVICPETGEL